MSINLNPNFPRNEFMLMPIHYEQQQSIYTLPSAASPGSYPLVFTWSFHTTSTMREITHATEGGSEVEYSRLNRYAKDVSQKKISSDEDRKNPRLANVDTTQR
jgi:hypothetical protein